jgi:hypothetical protein
MRRIHLLRVVEDPAAFARLFATADGAGMRIGWLELAAEPAAAPTPDGAVDLPAALRQAVLAGGARAVRVGGDHTATLRARKGPIPLRELLRQQFLGCALVLVRGTVEAPLLEGEADGAWQVSIRDAGARRFTAEALVAALRQPRPFAPAEPVT